jgi:hypothetical protein
LRTFIEAGNLGSGRTDFTERGAMWQVLIHVTFVASAIGIAFRQAERLRYAQAGRVRSSPHFIRPGAILPAAPRLEITG